MKAFEIEVCAAMTLPTMAFGNVRPEIRIHATLVEGEDPGAMAEVMQEQANALLHKHILTLLQLQKELAK